MSILGKSCVIRLYYMVAMGQNWFNWVESNNVFASFDIVRQNYQFVVEMLLHLKFKKINMSNQMTIYRKSTP